MRPARLSAGVRLVMRRMRRVICVVVASLVSAIASLAMAEARQATQRSGDAPRATPAKAGFFMSFHVHAFKGESYSLEIKRSEVRYRSGRYFLESDKSWRRVHVPKEKLEWFKKYVEEVGVFGWKESYVCPVFDGIGWRLELRSDARKVVSNGGNAFPPRFNELQLNIAWLVQARFGIAVQEKDCNDV